MKAAISSSPAEKIVLKLMESNVLRGGAVRLADRVIWEVIKRSDNPPGMKRDEWLTMRALAYSFDRIIRRGQVSEAAKHRFIEFARNRLGRNPRACNLNCTGCYAGTEKNPNTLSFSVFNRILKEMQSLWGACFVVISGGEPFLYRSEGKDLLDVAEAHPDMYFLVYTNGSQIDKKTAARMGRLGNMTPAISVEGKMATTEARRGEGVFGKVMNAFGNLRTSGVPFGLSMTATRHNCDELFSDGVVKFYFEEQGAMYAWVFQYMPIGRNYDLSLMVTPQQRLRLQRRMWEVIKEKKVFLMDFWNSGTATHGCLAAGRQNLRPRRHDHGPDGDRFLQADP